MPTVTLSNPGTQSNHIGDYPMFGLTWTDTSSYTMNFSMTGQPPGVSISNYAMMQGSISSSANTSTPYSVTVTATDSGTNESASVTFSWAISVVPPSIMAMGDFLSGSHDHTLTANVLANDYISNSDTLTATLVSGPIHGSATLASNGALSYTPSAGYVGWDSLTYTASADGVSAQTMVYINVSNQAPTLQGNSYSVGDDQILPGVDLLANASDADGDLLTMSITSNLSHGQLTKNDDGTWDYTRDAGWAGTDSVSATVSDGITSSSTVTFYFSATNAVKPWVGISGDWQGASAPIGTSGMRDTITLEFYRIGPPEIYADALIVHYQINWNNVDRCTALEDAGGTFAASDTIEIPACMVKASVVLTPQMTYHPTGGIGRFYVSITADDSYVVPGWRIDLGVSKPGYYGYPTAKVQIINATTLFASSNDDTSRADTGDSISVNDLVQTANSGCWLLSAFGAVANTDPEYIRNMLQMNGAGDGVCVQFYDLAGNALNHTTDVSLALPEGAEQPGLSADYDELGGDAGRTYEIWPIILQSAYEKEFGVGDQPSAAAAWRRMGLGKGTWFQWDTSATAAQHPDALQLPDNGSSTWTPVTNTTSLIDLLTAAQCTNQKITFSTANLPDTFTNVTTQGVTYQVRRNHAYVVESVDGDIIKLYDPANEAIADINAVDRHTVFITLANFISCGRAVTMV